MYRFYPDQKVKTTKSIIVSLKRGAGSILSIYIFHRKFLKKVKIPGSRRNVYPPPPTHNFHPLDPRPCFKLRCSYTRYNQSPVQ